MNSAIHLHSQAHAESNLQLYEAVKIRYHIRDIFQTISLHSRAYSFREYTPSRDHVDSLSRSYVNMIGRQTLLMALPHGGVDSFDVLSE